MSTDILQAIDGALFDYATSKDAMRWLPEERREPGGEPEDGFLFDGSAGAQFTGCRAVRADAFFPVTIDMASLAAAMNEAATAMARLGYRSSAAVTEDLLAAMAACREWRDILRRGGGKLAVDGHAYQRRLRNRRRHRRH